MDDYKILCLVIIFLLNVFAVGIICFWAWSLIKYAELRKITLEAAQDGDTITHWSDGRNVVSLILGLFCSWFTGNLTMIFVTYKMFGVEQAALIIIFAGISFSLLQIAWKHKPNH